MDGSCMADTVADLVREVEAMPLSRCTPRMSKEVQALIDRTPSVAARGSDSDTIPTITVQSPSVPRQSDRAVYTDSHAPPRLARHVPAHKHKHKTAKNALSDLQTNTLAVAPQARRKHILSCASGAAATTTTMRMPSPGAGWPRSGALDLDISTEDACAAAGRQSEAVHPAYVVDAAAWGCTAVPAHKVVGVDFGSSLPAAVRGDATGAAAAGCAAAQDTVAVHAGSGATVATETRELRAVTSFLPMPARREGARSPSSSADTTDAAAPVCAAPTPASSCAAAVSVSSVGDRDRDRSSASPVDGELVTALLASTATTGTDGASSCDVAVVHRTAAASCSASPPSAHDTSRCVSSSASVPLVFSTCFRKSHSLSTVPASRAESVGAASLVQPTSEAGAADMDVDVSVNVDAPGAGYAAPAHWGVGASPPARGAATAAAGLSPAPMDRCGRPADTAAHDALLGVHAAGGVRGYPGASGECVVSPGGRTHPAAAWAAPPRVPAGVRDEYVAAAGVSGALAQPAPAPWAGMGAEDGPPPATKLEAWYKDRLRKERAMWAAKQDTMRAEIDRLTRERAVFEEQLRGAEKVVREASLGGTARDATRRFEDAQRTIVRLEGEILQLQDQREQLQVANTTLTADAQKQQATRQHADDALAHMRGLVDKSAEELLARQAAAEDAARERETLSNDVKRLRLQLQSRSAECETAAAARDEFAKELRDAQRMVRDLRQAAAGAEESLATAVAGQRDGERQVATLQAEVARLTDAHTCGQEDVAALRVRVKTLQEEGEALSQQHEQLKSQHHDTSQELRTATLRAERAEMDAAHLKEQGEAMKSRTDASDEAAERSAALAEAAKKQVNERELEIHRLTLRVNACEEDAKRRRQAEQKAEEALAKATQDLAAARQQHQRDVQKLLHDKEEVDDRAHRLAVRLASVEGDARRTASTTKKAEEALQEELRRAQRDSRDTEEKLAESRAAAERAQAQLTGARREANDAAAAQGRAAQECEEAQQALAALTEELAGAVQARKDAQSDVAGGVERLRAAEDTAEALRASAAKATEELHTARAAQQALQRELADAKSTAAARERDASGALIALECLRGDLAKAQDAAKASKDAAAKVKAELASSLQARNALQGKLADANRVCAEAQKRVDEAVAGRLSAQHELATVQNEVTALRAAHDALATQASSSEPMARYVEELVRKYHQSETERRRLNNQLIEAKGNIRVACRMRPLTRGGQALPLEHTTPSTLTLTLPNGKDRSFKFDTLLAAGVQQEEVFATQVADLVPSVLDGYNVCIMAYGQTGSGKTHTMFGEDRGVRRGVIPRALERFWEQVGSSLTSLHDVACSLSMVEIYCGEVRDLLSGIAVPEPLSADTSLCGDSVCDDTSLASDTRRCTTAKFMMGSEAVTHKLVEVAGIDDCLAVMSEGYAKRAASATLCNERSSRSHCIVSLHYRAVFREAKQQEAEGLDDTMASGAAASVSTSVTTARMVLVDLGGSECVTKAGIEGIQIRECAHINRSLSALSDVLLALSAGKGHVPYRNSKLTHLLSDCLGGDAKMQLFVTINPEKSQLAETQHTLSFGHRARQVKRGPAARHVTSSDK